MLTLNPHGEDDDMQRKNWLEGSVGEAMTLQLEDLGSVGILRVLRIGAKYGPLNVSLFTRKSDMNHSRARTNVHYCPRTKRGK
jgi:hypothetical protein